MNYSQQKASDLEFIDSSFLRMLNMKSQRKNGRFWPVMKNNSSSDTKDKESV